MSRQIELDTWTFVAPEFVFGPETRHFAGRFAKNLGLRNALVVTDPVVLAAGWTEDVTASLKRAGIPYTIFSQVTSDPPAEEAMAGAECYKRERCDGIVAVGGGSPIDCAKGIGLVSSSGKHILEFEGVDRVVIPGPPLICVPTTAGSSADVSQFAVITDKKRQCKIVIVSKALVPDVSLIDPLTTTTLSSSLIASIGIDALSHAIEAFVSSSHSPITDLHALEAIRLIVENLPLVIAEPSNIDRRKRLVLGSLQAGLAFSNASLGAIHAMAHSLGGFLGVSHGECDAMLIGPVIDFNFEAATERYGLIAGAMGLDLGGMPIGEQRQALVDELDRLRKKLGVDRTLGQIGVTRGDIPELAEKAMRDPCMVTNPRRPSRLDIEAIFAEAL